MIEVVYASCQSTLICNMGLEYAAMVFAELVLTEHTGNLVWD